MRDTEELEGPLALLGALEEESAGSPCAIGRREKGEDMPTGLMGVFRYPIWSSIVMCLFMLCSSD